MICSGAAILKFEVGKILNIFERKETIYYNQEYSKMVIVKYSHDLK